VIFSNTHPPKTLKHSTPLLDNQPIDLNNIKLLLSPSHQNLLSNILHLRNYLSTGPKETVTKLARLFPHTPVFLSSLVTPPCPTQFKYKTAMSMGAVHADAAALAYERFSEPERVKRLNAPEVRQRGIFPSLPLSIPIPQFFFYILYSMTVKAKVGKALLEYRKNHPYTAHLYATLKDVEAADPKTAEQYKNHALKLLHRESKREER